MGLLDRFRKVQAVDSVTVQAADYYGAWRLSAQAYERIMGMSASEMWRTQPYLRTVVTFLARNIAQLGLHTYQRVGETDRRRLRNGGVADVLARPNRDSTAYELVFGLVADLALHDVAYWLLSDDPDNRITRLPVTWVTPKGGGLSTPDWYEVRSDDRGSAVRVPAESVFQFHGWHPDALAVGSSPVHALREILAEQVQAARYREHVWRRGGKVGAVLSRPAGAPEWSPEAREQFKADWDSQFTGNGPRVGGTPLLEDGMTLSRVDFNSKEMQFVEGSRLALNTVASVFHINPTMIGVLDNANYSNVREFRRMLYGDTLGPVLAMIEDRLNTFYVPMVDNRSNVYVEFNIEEKLQGNFEEQTAALQSATGAPWMTRNEARSIRNMPAVDGGDELVVPLNVLIGGQASPTDSAPAERSPLRAAARNLYLLKSRLSDRQAEQIASVLRRFFARQRDADRFGHGGEWDGNRWDRELADDLHRVALSVTDTLGKAEARRLGFTDADYDPDRTVEFLRAVAERQAQSVNRTTKAQLDVAIDAGTDPLDVYGLAINSRADGISEGLGHHLAAFATHEAAFQIAEAHGVEPTKTWVTGPNARPEHAALDGETVPIGDTFSDGSAYPGGVPGCNCSIEINL